MTFLLSSLSPLDVLLFKNMRWNSDPYYRRLALCALSRNRVMAKLCEDHDARKARYFQDEDCDR